MPDILITPTELRNLADELEVRAANIRERVAHTADIVNGSINSEVFAGNLASSLVTRFQQSHPTMEAWPGHLTQFATNLRSAADAFEQADLSGGSTGRDGGVLPGILGILPDGEGGGDGILSPEWLKERIDELHSIGDAGTPALIALITREVANNPAMKQRWEAFINAGGEKMLGVLGEAGTGLADLIVTGKSTDLLKGLLKAGETYVIKNDGLLDFAKETTDGIVDFAETGDVHKLADGVADGVVYLIPGGKEVMLGNEIVQFAGHGIAAVTHLGANFLAQGDPALVKAFNSQADELDAAVNSMDLKNAIHSTADNLVDVISGKETLGQGAGNVVNSVGSVLEGGVHSIFEVEKIGFTAFGSLTGDTGFANRVSNVQFSDFKTDVGNAVSDGWGNVRSFFHF